MYSLKRTCEKLLGGLSKKTLVIILALVVTTAATAGSTLAFLYGTQNVKNTFTYGSITIDLEETDTGLDDDDNPDTNEYTMTPGQDIHKDPKVTVSAGSMDCWLYVELQKSDNFDDFMTYTVASGWEPLPDVPNVYCRAVEESAEDQVFNVLQDDVVKMKESVTLGMMSMLTEADYPRLTFTAYAVQRDSSIDDTATASAAWKLLPAAQ